MGHVGRKPQVKLTSMKQKNTGTPFAEPSPAEFNQLLALYNARRFPEMEQRALQVASRFPNSGFAWKLLGAAQQMQGKNALAAFQKTAALMPNDAEAHFNLGVVQKALGQLEEAAASYRRAIKINPKYVEAHGNLGNVLKEAGRLEEAVTSYRNALRLRPGSADAHNNLGTALKELGQLESAAASYLKAVALKPNYADAFFNLGNVLKDIGKLDDAAANYRRATELKPDFADAFNNLGALLKKLRNLDEAVTVYRRTLELKPDFAEAHSNLGDILKELGDFDGAIALFHRAQELQPQAYQHAFYEHLLLPTIPASVDDIDSWRTRYRKGIEVLENLPGELVEPGEKLSGFSFYLAYHNADNRPFMEAICRMFRKRAPTLTFTAPHIPDWRPPAEDGRRIRVGFLSEYFYDHTIGKHYIGLIQHLDRARFEVVAIHGPSSRPDAFRNKLDSAADKSIVLTSKLGAQQQAVADAKLDVLFYPDIGMSPSTYFLAYSRLAPVQFNSWGHPDTSGLDTMDYYLAATGNEPEGNEGNYTERLVRLNRLPCFYYRTQAASIPDLSRAELGLPETGILYGCPQNLFKLHPDFDAVLAAIAEGDPTGHLILPAGQYDAWTEQLKARWARSFPILLERVAFMPRMSWDRFMASIAKMDVLLDPFYFGSGNTFYDAMIKGTPVVTLPGRFGRGRNVAAAYRQMDVADTPVANSPDDYARIALALGADAGRRELLRKTSLEAAGNIFEDMQAVRELESFLESAVVSAGNHELLPPGWIAPGNPQ